MQNREQRNKHNEVSQITQEEENQQNQAPTFQVSLPFHQKARNRHRVVVFCVSSVTMSLTASSPKSLDCFCLHNFKALCGVFFFLFIFLKNIRYLTSHYFYYFLLVIICTNITRHFCCLCVWVLTLP